MKTYTARWYHRVGIWFGIGLNPASITLGGGLAAQLPFSTLYWVIPVGAVLLISMSIASGLIGQKLRAPFARWSVSTFGLGIGALTLNLIMAFGMIGWHGFQLGLAGTALSGLLRTPGWIGIVLLALIVAVASFSNINRWNWIAWITSISAILLAVSTLFTIGIGVSESYEPAQFSMRIAVWAIGTMVAYAALFALRVPDFTWDLATPRDVIIDGLAFLGAFLIGVSVGALLYRSTGSWDLAVILADTPIAFIAQVFLVLSLMSPTLSTIHSGALAWSNVLPINSRVAIPLFVSIGLILGLTRFDQQLLPFLDWLGAITPSALAVMICAMFVRRYTSTKWTLGSWAIGAACALALKISGQNIHLIVGVSVSLTLLFSSILFKPGPRLNARR